MANVDNDLLGGAPTPGGHTEQYGYYQDPLAKHNNGVATYGHNDQIYDPQAWGGESYMTDANGKYVDGTTGAQKDAAYYRNQGQQSSTAVQLDPRAMAPSADQGGALAVMQNAAYGNAPSQAVAQGNISQSDAMRAQMAGAMGAQGGLGAQLGAMRGGMNAGGMQMGSLAAATMNGRAGEMAQSQGQYAGMAGTMRGQSDQAGIAQAQLDAQQRALQQQRQQAYEKMAWDTTNAQMQAANESRTQGQRQSLAERQARFAEGNATTQKIIDGGSLVVGAVTGPVGAAAVRGAGSAVQSAGSDPGPDDGTTPSDRRMKEDVHPMGSLACLMRK